MLAFRNTATLKAFELLDTSKHYHDMVYYLANHDAPLDYLIAGELAQLQTFGIPSISKILRRTRQYEDHGTKRLDDTRAILVEIMTDSVHSERGQHMVKHLNWIHSHYPITNDDYLYTLALFIFEPDRWMNTFGYRALTNAERHAMYLEFRDLGDAMNIQDIPPSYWAFKSWYQAYRKQHLRYHPDNQVVAEGLIHGMKPMLPLILRPFTQTIILTLLNDKELTLALGKKQPGAFAQGLIKGVMGIRKTLLRWFNPWQKKPFDKGRIASNYPTYPGGYEGHTLGPEKLVKAAAKRKVSGCPYHHS